MTGVLVAIPFLLSWLTGYLTIEILCRNKRPPFWIHLFLAGGLGMGISAQLSFLQLILFDRFSPSTMTAVHLILCTVLFAQRLIWTQKRSIEPFDRPSLTKLNFLAFGIVTAALLPIVLQAVYYPYGGWDAWAVWNFKAKFIFLGGDRWQNVLDPRIWRSSPHYPLMLPLMNVWGWSFIRHTVPSVPMITSVAFTFFTAGLLCFSLRNWTRSYGLALLAPVLILTIPLFGKLASSQYSDIVLGFYLLAGAVSLISALKEGSQAQAILAGIFTGMLSFTKPEGVVAAGLFTVLAGILIWRRPEHRPRLSGYLIGLVVAGLPTAIFLIFYSPGNQTFINGLVSETHPATLYRMKMIVAFFLVELKHPKWNWVWIFLLGGIAWGRTTCFRKELAFIPAFLGLYMAAVLAYYFTNTYFEIAWWLQVTLNRILFSLLPLTVFWIFLSVGTRAVQSSGSDTSSHPPGP